jgi:hypothetical protein
LGTANNPALNMDVDNSEDQYRRLHGGNYSNDLQLNGLQGMNAHKYPEHSGLGNKSCRRRNCAVGAEEMVKADII